MKENKTFNIQHSTPNIEVAAYGAEWVLSETNGRKFDLEDRLLEFSSAVIDLSEQLPSSRAGNHVASQILRSGTSAYPNHGEAEAAESREDFIHKLRICLKELRETRRWARLIERKKWIKAGSTLVLVLGEVDQLIRIFHTSIQTAQRNAAALKYPGSDRSSRRSNSEGSLDVER